MRFLFSLNGKILFRNISINMQLFVNKVVLRKIRVEGIFSCSTFASSSNSSTDQLSSSRQLTKHPVMSHKPKSKSGEEASTFVDFREVRCIAGTGGPGIVSFMRLKNEPFGGPDGGNGGNGGHIIFRADKKVADLSRVNKILKGNNGTPGSEMCCHGLCGEHLYIPVPLNTLIKSPRTGARTVEEGVIHELTRQDDIFIAARGGAGGHGNNFYLSNSSRKPIKAEFGGKGEDMEYELEMRLMATAGLVGFPNAGKSSFLRAISRARPKVASYPFTTLNPHVGQIQYDDFQQVAVADIPGLVEGAHKNIGLGFNFFKHITRCSCVLYFLDYTLKDYTVQLESLKREIELYSPGLSSKLDSALVVNKIDLMKDKAEIDIIRAMFPNQRMFFVSARERIGLEQVLVFLREQYDISLSNIERINAERELNSLL